MQGQYLANKPINVEYAFKKDGKGERHGTEAERLLAQEAKWVPFEARKVSRKSFTLIFGTDLQETRGIAGHARLSRYVQAAHAPNDRRLADGISLAIFQARHIQAEAVPWHPELLQARTGSLWLHHRQVFQCISPTWPSLAAYRLLLLLLSRLLPLASLLKRQYNNNNNNLWRMEQSTAALRHHHHRPCLDTCLNNYNNNLRRVFRSQQQQQGIHHHHCKGTHSTLSSSSKGWVACHLHLRHRR